MPQIGIGSWTPDQPDLGAGSTEKLNVIPAAASCKPFPGFGAFSTTALDNRCQGAAAFRSSSGALGLYAGDDAKLYIGDGADFTDASVSGGYSTDPVGRWIGVSFGALALFTNGVDPVQKITIDGGTAFADLGGSPPVGTYLAVCKDYVIIAGLASDLTAAQWCETNAPESWSIGSGGGDIQPIPDCGQVTGLIGGDFFLVLLERGVHRFDFIGGDIGFQRRQISSGIGCSIPGTVQGFNDRAFFWHETGFYQCVSGSAPIPIGDQRVNRYFRKKLASGGDAYVFSAIDPTNSLYIVGFCSSGDSSFLITEMMVFKWDLGAMGEWAHAADGNSYDVLFNGLSSTNTTMEDLDIYGTMEAVPYSLDSPIWVGTGHQLFGAFNSDHYAGWFNGTPLPATVTTTEAEINDGQMTLVRGYRPLVPGAALANISGSILARNTPADMPASNANSSGKAPNARGLIRARIKGRYHRAEIMVSDPNWSDLQGIEGVEAYAVGSR